MGSHRVGHDSHDLAAAAAAAALFLETQKKGYFSQIPSCCLIKDSSTTCLWHRCRSFPFRMVLQDFHIISCGSKVTLESRIISHFCSREQPSVYQLGNELRSLTFHYALFIHVIRKEVKLELHYRNVHKLIISGIQGKGR